MLHLLHSSLQKTVVCVYTAWVWLMTLVMYSGDVTSCLATSCHLLFSCVYCRSCKSGQCDMEAKVMVDIYGD